MGGGGEELNLNKKYQQQAHEIKVDLLISAKFRGAQKREMGGFTVSQVAPK